MVQCDWLIGTKGNEVVPGNPGRSGKTVSCTIVPQSVRVIMEKHHSVYDLNNKISVCTHLFLCVCTSI